MRNFILGVCTLVEITGIVGLAAIGLKRNNDAYNAEMKAIELEGKLFVQKVDCAIKDAEIKQLKKELEELQTKN